MALISTSSLLMLDELFRKQIRSTNKFDGSGCYMDKTAFLILQFVLPINWKGECLDLSSNCINSMEDVNELIKIIRKIDVKRIDISYNDMESDSLYKILKEICSKPTPNMESLSISASSIDSRVCDIIEEMFNKFPNFTTLEIEDSDVDPDCLDKLNLLVNVWKNDGKTVNYSLSLD